MTNVANVIQIIESGEKTQKQLFALYENTMRYEGISEEDRERIITALEKQLRVKFPAAAKKIFGAKDFGAREILERIFSVAEKEFDLSKNTLKNGVKTGGLMISGQHHIDVYLSYKNSSGEAASLTMSQENIDDELKAIVRRYKTGGEDAGISLEKPYGIDLEEIFTAEFMNILSEVLEI